MVRAKDQFGISGINKGDTRVASNYYSIEDKKNVINYQRKKQMILTMSQKVMNWNL